ncbi:MAG: hypothetical protein GXN93_03740 [Candidatus Diapherotrites archaeon]|nr:hypothetical protein [Candidatus Diapherotrites archaeon]
MGRWEEYRKRHLRKYEAARNAGAVDPPIVKILDIINSREDYVTTSSCSGRIAILAASEREKKGETYFYRKWHRPIMHNELQDALNTYSGKGRLIFKVDPFILHVGARNVAAASRLIQIARNAGVKIAGIQSIDETKAHVEIRGIDAVALPVWDGRKLIDEDYEKYLVRYANWKMLRNQQRLERLYRIVSTEL